MLLRLNQAYSYRPEGDIYINADLLECKHDAYQCVVSRESGLSMTPIVYLCSAHSATTIPSVSMVLYPKLGEQ